MLRPDRRLALALLCAPLLACGGEEAQAAALQRFLQTRLLDRQGLAVPRPNEEERKSFGRFAQDYDVILAFHDRMNGSVTSKLGEVVRRGSFNRAQDFIDRRGDIAAARDGLQAMGAALDGALAEAEKGRAGLTQPDALRTTYGQAFERVVSRPAAVVRDVLPAADGVFAQGLAFSDFLAANRNDLKFNGATVEISKANLLTEFNGRARSLQQTGERLLEGQRRMQALLRGE